MVWAFGGLNVKHTTLHPTKALTTPYKLPNQPQAHRELVDDDRGASVTGALWRLGLLLPPNHFQAGLHAALVASQAVSEQLASAPERARACEGMCAAAAAGAAALSGGGGGGGSRAVRAEQRRFGREASGLAWRCRDNARRWRKKGLAS